MKVWVIIEYIEPGPTNIWVFDSEVKARDYGIELLMMGLAGRKYRIGEETVR